MDLDSALFLYRTRYERKLLDAGWSAMYARHHADLSVKELRRREVKGAKNGRKYGSTQFDLKPGLLDEGADVVPLVLKLALSIPDADLAEDGRELEPHVTVKYGLWTDDPDDVRRAVLGSGPVALTVGPPAVFPAKQTDPQRGGDSHDVLYLTVSGPGLVALNARLSSLPHTDTHPTYVPHVCLAYLKPGLGDLYATGGHLDPELLAQVVGQSLTLRFLTFSDAAGNTTRIDLGEGVMPTPVAKRVGNCLAVRKDKKESYFATCERDKLGHCVEEGRAGSGQAAPERGTRQERTSPRVPPAGSADAPKSALSAPDAAEAPPGGLKGPLNNLPGGGKASSTAPKDESGKEVPVPPVPVGADANDHATSFRHAVEQYTSLKDEYLKGREGKTGNGRYDKDGNLTSIVLNTDDWRALFPEYKGTNASNVHEASSYCNNKLFAEALQTMKGKGNGKMVVLAGGGGSGKSGVGKFMELEQYPIQLDQVSDNLDKLGKKMKQAADAGFGSDYVFVDRDPEDAWLNGVVKRALALEKSGELPRTVNIEIALKANLDARKAALGYFKQHKDAPVRVLDNTKGFDNQRFVKNRGEAVRFISRQAQEYPKLLRKLTAATLQLHKEGKIPDHILQGLLGGLGKGAKKQKSYKRHTDDSQRVFKQRQVPVDHARRLDTQGANAARRLQVRRGQGARRVGGGVDRPAKGRLEGADRKAGGPGLRKNTRRGYGGGGANGEGVSVFARALTDGVDEERLRYLDPGGLPAEVVVGKSESFFATCEHDPKTGGCLPRGQVGAGKKPRRARKPKPAVVTPPAAHPKAVQAAAQLKQFLSIGVGIGIDVFIPEPDAAYHSPVKYVLDKGKEFLGSPLPAGVKKGTPKECFRNAGRLVTSTPGLTYCEGFAMSEGLLPVLHAWAVTEDGKVVDNTFADPEHCAYVGVSYDTRQYIRHTIAKGFHGVLGGDQDDAADVLRKGGLG